MNEKRNQEKAKKSEIALETAGKLEIGSLLKIFTVMRQTHSALQLFHAVKELCWYKQSDSGFVRMPFPKVLWARHWVSGRPTWGGESKHYLEEHETQAQAADLSSVRDDTTSGGLCSLASLGGRSGARDYREDLFFYFSDTACKLLAGQYRKT